MPFRGIWRESGRWSRGRLLLVAASITCITVALGLAAQIGWFFRTSSVHGAALIDRERQVIGAARLNARACQGSVGNAGRVLASGSTSEGLLEIPALGLVAPVLQGTGEEVLNDAVGHVPASAWPGTSGTSVLAAHDVTWFSRINRLSAGDQIRYVTPCRTFAYQVSSHQIVRAGSPVYNTVAGRIVLDTCYPLDALYITDLRYLVYADLVETTPTAPMPLPAAAPAPLTVHAPAALAAQGLGLEQNEAPLGTLTVSGSPSPGWRQTSAPLQDEAAALTAYFGVIRSAEQGERGWWSDLAPSVPQSAAEGIWGGQITTYGTRLGITLRVTGSQVLGAQLTATITAAGSARPGTYDLTVTETVTGQHRLVVSGFTMRAG